MQNRRRRQGSVPSQPARKADTRRFIYKFLPQIQQKRRFVLPLYHAKLLNCDYRIARFCPVWQEENRFFRVLPADAPFRSGFRCICTKDRALRKAQKSPSGSLSEGAVRFSYLPAAGASASLRDVAYHDDEEPGFAILILPPSEADPVAGCKESGLVPSILIRFRQYQSVVVTEVDGLLDGVRPSLRPLHSRR